MTKEIKGVDDGTPFNMKYVPSRDIRSEYGVDVRYGIMSGLNPNNAIIALLQMRSDKLVSRDYVRREIPMELNVTQEEQRVDIEEMRDSLRVAVAGTTKCTNEDNDVYLANNLYTNTWSSYIETLFCILQLLPITTLFAMKTF